MTNDQKLVKLMNDVSEYIRAEEKADTAPHFKSNAKKLRNEVKIFCINNRVISPNAPVRKQKQLYKTNHAAQWLGQ